MPYSSTFAGGNILSLFLLDRSMTPVAMNPPSPFLLADQIEGHQHQLFVSPLNQDSSNPLSSCPSFFHLLDQTQTRETRRELRHDQEEQVSHGGSSSHQVCNSSFNSPPPQQVKDDRRNACGGYREEEEEEEEESNKSRYESAQWMPSKTRLMRKMMIPSTSPVPHRGSNVTPNIQTREHQKTQTQKNPSNNHRNNTTTRVCADCNTTSTPLWRGGPKGPKSLCNACGIRQRKARRALMGEAGNGAVSCRLNSKEKKARSNHSVVLKNNKCKATTASSEGTYEGERNKNNIGFKDLALSFRHNVSVVEQVFPPADEVAQAALLLMDLSYASVPI